MGFTWEDLKILEKTWKKLKNLEKTWMRTWLSLNVHLSFIECALDFWRPFLGIPIVVRPFEWFLLGASVKSRDSAKVAQPVNSQVIVDVAILFRSRWVFLRYAERAIHLWIHRYFPNSLISPIIIMICWNGHPPVNSQVFWRIFDIKTSSQDMFKGPSTCEFTGISNNLWYPKVFSRYVERAIHLWIHRYFEESLISNSLLKICSKGHPPVNSQVFPVIFDIQKSSKSWRLCDMFRSHPNKLNGPPDCEFTGNLKIWWNI